MITYTYRPFPKMATSMRIWLRQTLQKQSQGSYVRNIWGLCERTVITVTNGYSGVSDQLKQDIYEDIV